MATTIDLNEARRRVLAEAPSPLALAGRRETVPLDEALGRSLAESIRCPGPWPATDRSAMDGFALRAGAPAGAILRVVGEALAGRPSAAVLQPGEALRIMTGAVLPSGADAVARVEDSSGFDGFEGDRGRVRIAVAVSPGANVRRCGSELGAGETVLRAGQLLRAAELGVLAVLGVGAVPVRVRPRVAILSTGDEVVDVASVPLPHQVRDSNSHALAAQCRECGAQPWRLGIAPDRRDGLRAMLERGLAAEVLVTIGGISAGTHDLVAPLLAELGVREVFHGVQLKPGKPTYFGVLETAGRRSWVFGLPGNPASAFTTFDLFVAPLLERLLGREPAAGLVARAAGSAPRANPRAQAIPARLATGPDGALVAQLRAVRTSGDPFGLLDADAHAIVPADAAIDASAALRVVPYAATRGIGGA
jgi:molybdopterin molybdotransferase